MDKRRMCPHCRAFITTDDKVCPYCQAEVGPRAVDRRASGEGLLAGERFVTTVILLINAGLFIATLLMYPLVTGTFDIPVDYRALLRFGAMFKPAILAGEWWRLIAAGFLHGSVLHILMNSWVLFDLGPQVDSAFGTSRFITIYFVSTVTGFLASFAYTQGFSVGGSAAACGLIGAMIALGTRERHTIVGAMRGAYVRWVVILLVFGFMVPGIDNAAHIGGLAGGFGLGYVAGTPTARESSESVWRVAAGVALAFTAYAFFKMYLSATA
jgi:rhomboid protease GluP